MWKASPEREIQVRWSLMFLWGRLRMRAWKMCSLGLRSACVITLQVGEHRPFGQGAFNEANQRAMKLTGDPCALRPDS